MKRLFALSALAAGLAGCVHSPPPPVVAEPPAPPPPPYASLDAAGQLDRLTSEMRVIATALRAYTRDHNGQLPPRLTDLVDKGYLPATALISSADPTGGREGGVPDLYKEWGQAAETDEPGSSYLYEFSAAPCKWEWQSYLAGKPSVADVDANGDGVVSWAEIKSWQLRHGDVTQQPTSGPYSLSRFPLVRCYWHRYPDAYENPTGRTVLNLALDLETIFLSQPWWEKDN